MKAHQIQVGSMQNFSYIVEDEDTSEAIIIDPSWDLIELETVIKKNNLKIKYIVNTHHHFDHTLGNEAMAESTKAPIIQHESSELKHDITVKDGDFIEFGNSRLKVLHTPGHSQDSICLVGDGKIFLATHCLSEIAAELICLEAVQKISITACLMYCTIWMKI